MQGEPESIRRLVETLTGEALKQFLQNLRHHVEVQRRVARGELRPDQVNIAYVKYAVREGRGYRDEVGRLTAQYYRDLVAIGGRYSERFYEELLASSAATAVEPESSDGTERVSLELHGLPGREVVRRIALENPDSTDADVTFELGECRGPDGVPFTAPLAVQPARLTIPSGGRAEITLRLALLPSLFSPGNVYTTTIDVRGQQELTLELVIWAEEEVHIATSQPAREPASEPAAADTGAARFVVRCPDCGRTFTRSRRDARLRAHKAPDGTACPGRRGDIAANDGRTSRAPRPAPADAVPVLPATRPRRRARRGTGSGDGRDAPGESAAST
jgi:hypothetical protein